MGHTKPVIVAWRAASPIFVAADEVAGKKGPQEILTSAKEMLDSAKQADDNKALATAMIASATGYLAMAATEKALLTAVEVRKLFRDANMPTEEATALLMIADVQLGKGLAEEALGVAQESLRLAQASADKKIECAAQQITANALLMLSRSEEALHTATRALTIAKSTGDKAREASACAQIAEAQVAKGSADAARGKADEAVAMYKAAGDKAGEAYAMQTLAKVHVLRKDFDAALAACTGSQSIFAELADEAGKASALNAAAGVHHAKGDSAEGLRAAREALTIFRRAGDERGVRQCQETCTLLRRKPEAQKVPEKAVAPLGVTKLMPQCAAGVSGPGALPLEPWVSVLRVCGTSETRKLSGLVTVVTGASRGIGKGIAHMLAEAGAIVYVTGRSAPGKLTDAQVGGSPDETATAFQKLGGVGVATHLDHSQEEQNQALVDAVERNHGRLDLLVNNAPCAKKLDPGYFGAPVWAQPTGAINEQVESGEFSHAAQTMRFTPALRRGRGLVINITSSQGSAVNAPVIPMEAFDGRVSAEQSHAELAQRLRQHGVHVINLWPGRVKTERVEMIAKEKGTLEVDLEMTRFSGQAVVKLASMQPDELSRFAPTHRTLSSADVAKWEADGYMHEGNIQTHATGGRTTFK